MPRSKSNNGKAAYHPMTVAQLWRLALPTAALALGGLILASCPLEIALQAPQATPTSAVHSLQTPDVTPTSTVCPPLEIEPPAWARTYYVDSSLGSDRNSCASAENPSTPKRTVSGVMSCDPGPGEIVRFRGVFTETIEPKRSGTVLFDVQDIAQVNGSVVTFNQEITDLYPPTDYVAVFGSRKGNSGAFAIISVCGNHVTVDTSDLPAGQFLPEAASDPGTLQAAVLRPVHFTAWEYSDPPVWDGDSQTYRCVDQSVIMLSHIKSVSGYPRTSEIIWPAVEIDGTNGGQSDFQIFDHLEIVNAEAAIATEYREFQSNYDIIQFCNLHHTGYTGNVSDEVIYFGNAHAPERHHDYVQIMYNRIGPHKQDYTSGTPIIGDGVEFKPSAHNATLFGNEIYGIVPNGCDDAPVNTAARNTFIANNYIHDINPQSSLGCGISIGDGAEGAIVVNNIVANVKRVGIRVLDVGNVQILNNTVYNIFPEPDCDSACMENNMGIQVQNWQGSTPHITIKNNIVQTAHIGIGRYVWSNDYPVSIDSDYNLVFDSEFPFRGTIITNTHDLVTDPGLVDPQNHDFALMDTSPARDSGSDLTSVFGVDNHDAADPTLPTITAPIIRTDVWDRGAYEYEETQVAH